MRVLFVKIYIALRKQKIFVPLKSYHPQVNQPVVLHHLLLHSQHKQDCRHIPIFFICRWFVVIFIKTNIFTLKN